MIKKIIIITGGLGFIGTNLIERLRKKNFQIYNFDKLSKQSNLKFYNYKDKKYKFQKINKVSNLISIIQSRIGLEIGNLD